MDRSAMLEKMKEVVVDQLALDASKVVEDADFVKDFGADSLDLLQLMTALEDEFSVSIPDEEFENLRSVRDVLDLVERVSGKQ